MTTNTTSDPLTQREREQLALLIVDRLPAMVAYWDASQTCRFANAAYTSWFGWTADQLLGRTMQELLGPLYALNLPYIQAALAGQPQVFERSIPLPDGTGMRESLASYIPHEVDGRIAGFFVLVSDSGLLKQRERELTQAIAERDAALSEVRELKRFLSMCASCRRVRDEDGAWTELEMYVRAHTHTEFSHGICPDCVRQLYPAFAHIADG
jgi:PAS domain S-box-containing protein